MGGVSLPPGPREPLALQTIEWIARPTALLRRSQARYGEPFTVRVAWADAPMVLVSDPESIRQRVHGRAVGPAGRLELDRARAVRRPVARSSSCTAPSTCASAG